MSLRQDLKSKTSKKSTCTKSESEATKTPAAIKELVKHFEDPEITVWCPVKISKGNDSEGDLNHVTRKHLTKLLKAFGLPALKGKKKSRQISTILSHLRDVDAPVTFRHPEKVSYPYNRASNQN